MMRRILLGWLGLASLAPAEEIKKLSGDELKAMLKEDVFLLDVREPQEIEEFGTLKGYTNIPMGQIEARMKELPKNKRILVA